MADIYKNFTTAYMRLIYCFMALAIGCACASAQNSRFSWGADLGGAIDMTGNDMSTVNLGAYFGYSGHGINMAGIGAGINMMVNNSCRAIPVYAIVRTSFSSRPRVVFADMRGGVVINNLPGSVTRTGAYLSPGVGFNLARGKAFTSYLTVSYVYNGMRPFDDGDQHRDIEGLHLACVRLGICF